MSMSDPIADMLARLRNAQSAGHLSVSFPYSNLKKGLVDVLEREGYIRGSEVREIAAKNPKKVAQKELYVELKYYEGKPAIQAIKRVSKLGRRVYSSVKKLAPVFNGLGVSILSTSKGVLSDHEAKQQNVAGELLCIVF